MPPTVELDQERAAAANERQLVVSTTADEILVLDLVLPSAPGTHWIVEQLCLTANLTVRAPADARGMSPLSGLFLCPPSPVAVETPAQSLAGQWIQNARGIVLPLSDPLLNFGTVAAGPPFALAMSLCAGFKITVPIDWVLRGIVACQVGTVTPGPGAASRGMLRALCRQEQDNPCG